MNEEMINSEDQVFRLFNSEWVKLLFVVLTPVAVGAWYMSAMVSDISQNSESSATNSKNIGEMTAALKTLTNQTTKVVSKLEAATPADVLQEVRALKIPTKEQIKEMILLNQFHLQERVTSLEAKTLDRVYRSEVREWIADFRQWISEVWRLIAPDQKLPAPFPTLKNGGEGK